MSAPSPWVEPMEPLRQLSNERGYFLRREALRFGVDDKALHRGVRAGRLVRIRQGAYCHAALWHVLSAQDQYLARSLAAYDLSVGDVSLSHVTALAAYGCPLWNTPLDRTHLTYLGEGTSQAEAGVTRHLRGTIEPSEFIERGGRHLTSPGWSTIGGMSLMAMEPSVIAGDWMIAQGLTTQEQLWDLKTRLNQHPRTRQLEVAIRLLDGRSQSVGESRGHYLFWLMGLPRPELQWEIYDGADLVAVTDFAWPEHNTYGEFDGKIKYGRLLKPGQDPGDVVFAEKRREDDIRRVTNGTVVRWTWVDLTPFSAPSRQASALLRRAA
jgi:hypothetical protein